MNAKIQANTLLFDGVLDEAAAQDMLMKYFSKLQDGGAKAPYCLDLSEVRYGNSVGVICWLKFTKQAGVQFKYVNAPIWLVNQFNVINNYFDNQSFCESLHAPYFSPKTQDSRTFTLYVGKDIPVLEDYSTFKMPSKVVDGVSYDIDFDPQRYFYFITENYQLFKSKFGKAA